MCEEISQAVLERLFTDDFLVCMQHEGISALLFRTGYDKMTERGVTDDFNFPYFDVEAAALLVEACERQGIHLNILGLDSFSVDPKGTLDSPAHCAFLLNDILILETLVHLEKVVQALDDEPFELICPPILYQGADGAQVRTFIRAIRTLSKEEPSNVQNS